MTTDLSKPAENQTIFIIDYDGSTPKVVETNLLEFMMESLDETTTPKGVGSRLFVEEVEFNFDVTDYEDLEEALSMNSIYLWDKARYTNKRDWECLNGEDYFITLYTVSTWGVRGNNYSEGTEFYKEILGAENKWFEALGWDFEKDDTRDTQYYDTEEECEDALVEFMAEEWGCSFGTAKHIMRKMEELQNLRIEKQNNLRKKENKRVVDLTTIYADMIEPVAGESYKETAKRLSDALDSKIEGKIFHKTIKIIRSKS